MEFAKPEVVLVDKEYEGLVRGYKCKRTIVDEDRDGKSGEYEDIVRKGQSIDIERGGKGWDDLVIDDIEETDTMVLNCTSGTTSNPKVSLPQNSLMCVVCGDDVSGDLFGGYDEYHRKWIELRDTARTRRLQISMDIAHVPLCRLDLPLERHCCRRRPCLSP